MNMEKITVHVEDNSKEVLDALQNAVERGLMAIGEQAVTHAKDNLTSLGAVDTGRLRNSITYALSGHPGRTLKYTKEMQKAGREAAPLEIRVSEDNVVYIGSAVFYAPYIELGTGQYSSVGGGTSKKSWVYRDEFGQMHIGKPQKPRPYLKPAVADHQKEYMDMLRESLKNA